MSIVTVNAGSSSIKLSVYREGASGDLERLAFRDFQQMMDLNTVSGERRSISESLFQHATEWPADHLGPDEIAAVGHRVVHGGVHFCESVWVDDEVVNRLDECIPLAPNHLPFAIDLIRMFRDRLPQVRQIACFDTAFHAGLPRVAALLPIPRRFQQEGIRRYGFHGISYAYLMAELERLAGQSVAHGRIVLAHLGNGASMAAVHEGRCIDTSMSLTPTGGLVMGTRTGDLDPGVLVYLMREHPWSSEQLDRLVTCESGLIGLSETSSDMRDLLSRRATDPRAEDAVAAFCYQAKKQIGAYMAVLNGLDTLVFSGGIGERSSDVRRDICHTLDGCGIRLDDERNLSNAAIISTDDSPVTVRVIPTNEELMIARDVRRLLANFQHRPASREIP